MSKTDPKAETATAKKSADKKVRGTVIDHLATSPSNDPNKEERQANSATTEPNSAQRIAERTTRRSGRNNGGDESDTRARPGLGMAKDLAPDTLGEREGVSPAETDLIWTNASKDKWGVDQPSLADQLAQRDKIGEKLADA